MGKKIRKVQGVRFTKLEKGLSTEDKFRLELQRMERENERLRAENLFFKVR